MGTQPISASSVGTLLLIRHKSQAFPPGRRGVISGLGFHYVPSVEAVLTIGGLRLRKLRNGISLKNLM